MLKVRNKIHHKRYSRISHLHISSSLCSKSIWAHKPLFVCTPFSPTFQWVYKSTRSGYRLGRDSTFWYPQAQAAAARVASQAKQATLLCKLGDLGRWVGGAAMGWRDSIIGDYNWAFLCLPSLKHKRAAPPFYGKDEKISLVMATIMGLQHALSMVKNFLRLFIKCFADGGNFPLIALFFGWI